MTVTDRERLDLHRKLEATLGEKEADTLMAHLPPVTWQDVATKRDLDVLRIDFRAELAELRVEMERGFTRQTRWLAGLMAGWSSVLLAAIVAFS
jgi:hypothetical protein